MNSERLRSLLLLFDESICDFIRDLTRRNVVRNGRGQLFFAVHFLEVRSVATDAHGGVQPINRQRTRFARIDISFFMLNLFVESFAASIKLPKVGQAICRAGRNVVQCLFHAGRESQIHKVRKMILEQLGHGHRRKCRHKLIAILTHIPAILNRAQNAGVCTWTTNAFRFERPDQCRFSKPCRGLGFMRDRVHILTLQHVLL